MTLFSEESQPASTSEASLEETPAETDSSKQQEQNEELESLTTKDNSQTAEQQAQEELQVYKDKYMRLAAEFENYKRRAQRDQSDAIRYANESLLKSLLSTIDNLERAMQSGKTAGETGPLLEGIELTYKHFLETVGKLGVRQITSIETSFDPSMHQAVAQVESETAKPNTIVEEFQKGYFLHDRILRPAMVTVAKEQSSKTEPPTAPDTGKEGGIEA